MFAFAATQSVVTNIDSNKPRQPPEKKIRSDATEYEDVNEIVSLIDTVEVTSYLQGRVLADQDILAWWKEQTQFPKLRALARQLLAIPASSAAAASDHSVLLVVVSARRTTLSSENVDDILFIHSNRLTDRVIAYNYMLYWQFMTD
jgi:hypothetical protein